MGGCLLLRGEETGSHLKYQTTSMGEVWQRMAKSDRGGRTWGGKRMGFIGEKWGRGTGRRLRGERGPRKYKLAQTLRRCWKCNSRYVVEFVGVKKNERIG